MSLYLIIKAIRARLDLTSHQKERAVDHVRWFHAHYGFDN